MKWAENLRFEKFQEDNYQKIYYSLLILRGIEVNQLASLNIRNEFWRGSSIAISLPLDETHLVLVRGLIHPKVSPKWVNEESSTGRRS